jgi:hypothetical protein
MPTIQTGQTADHPTTIDIMYRNDRLQELWEAFCDIFRICLSVSVGMAACVVSLIVVANDVKTGRLPRVLGAPVAMIMVSAIVAATAIIAAP